MSAESAPAPAEPAAEAPAPQLQQPVRYDHLPMGATRVSRKRGRRKALPQGVDGRGQLMSFEFQSIGHFQSMFRGKFGTPRQGGLVSPSSSRAKLTLRPELGTTCLEGLEQYSHVWLVWVFHENKVRDRNNTGVPVFTKVKPPRLSGGKVGVFACRSPHRPNPIGLSLVRLDRVEGRTLWFSGVDLVEGTPILDVKIHHPLDHCDSLMSGGGLSPPSLLEAAARSQQPPARQGSACRHPEWVDPTPPLPVRLTPHARRQLHDIFVAAEGGDEADDEEQEGADQAEESEEAEEKLQALSVADNAQPEADQEQEQEQENLQDSAEPPEFLFLRSEEEAVLAIQEVLSFDPRSTYSKRQQRGFLYGVYLDKLEVVFRYLEADGGAEPDADSPAAAAAVVAQDEAGDQPDDAEDGSESRPGDAVVVGIEVCWIEYHPEVHARDLPPLRTKEWNIKTRAKLASVVGVLPPPSKSKKRLPANPAEVEVEA